jgi:hypothetical protein
VALHLRETFAVGAAVVVAAIAATRLEAGPPSDLVVRHGESIPDQLVEATLPVSVILPTPSGSASMARMPEEMGIYRGEVRTIMIARADIRVELQRIRQMLEDENGEEEEDEEGDL